MTKAFRTPIIHEDLMLRYLRDPAGNPYSAEAEVGRLLFAWTRAEDALRQACSYWGEVHALLDETRTVNPWKDPRNNFKMIENWRQMYVGSGDAIGSETLATLKQACEWRNNCAHNVHATLHSDLWPNEVTGHVAKRNFEKAKAEWLVRFRKTRDVQKAGPIPTQSDSFTYTADEIRRLADRCSVAARIVNAMEFSLKRHYEWRERGARRIRMCRGDADCIAVHREVLLQEDLQRARAARAQDPNGWRRSFSASFSNFDFDSV